MRGSRSLIAGTDGHRRVRHRRRGHPPRTCCAGPARVRRSASTRTRCESSFDDTLKDPVYESLIAFDSDMSMSGHLATRWKPLDPTTWEFKLRENVRSTMARRSPLTTWSSASGAPRRRRPQRKTLKKIAGVEAIDPHTVHVTTERPAAVLWYDLSYVTNHVESLGRTPRRHPAGRLRQRGANLCHGPCQRHRAVHPRRVRDGRRLRHGPQPGLVGLRALPAQHRSDRAPAGREHGGRGRACCAARSTFFMGSRTRPSSASSGPMA